MSKSVKLGFERDCLNIPLDKLNLSKPLPVAIQKTVKYLQIRASIQAVGLVEPLVVILNSEQPGNFRILDGHLRLEALRDIGKANALCLISTDNEGYTYNKRVNRLSAIQEHRMIVRAAERGVSTQRLASALSISEDAIRQRFRLLDGICEEVVCLLADKPAPRGMFRVLQQLKPFRQIDVAQAMVNFNDFSIKFAQAMLQSTPADQLSEKAAARVQQSGASEALHRLERELAAIQADTKLLEDSYGPNNLKLVIIKTYISSLLDNARVVGWLARSHRDYLLELQKIAEIKQLPTE